MKILKKTALILLIFFLGLQFFKPDKNSDESNHLAIFIAETNPPKEVREIFQSSCHDCHSNNTEYPWYSNITPVSYWLSGHVNHGKGNLNFSEWDSYNVKKKDHKLEEIIEEIEAGNMPLREYTWTHEEAKLTDTQRESLIAWAKQTRVLYQLNLKQEKEVR